MSYFLTLMFFVALCISLQQVLVSIYSVFMVIEFKRQEKKFASEFRGKKMFVYHGISVVTSIKGVVQSLEKSLLSLVNQDYPGPLEIIIAIEDPNDPALNESKRILAHAPKHIEIKWLTDFEIPPVNPRTFKLLYGIQESKHPWIYCHAADTYFDSSYFSKLIFKTNLDPNVFTTMLTLQTGAKNLWAYFENAPIVWEATLGLLIGQKRRQTFINGCGFLFSREIFEKAKNVYEVANYLTEEVPFTNKFKEVGGRCELVPTIAWVDQDRESFLGFYLRRVRWAIMARFHHSSFYVLGILFSNLLAIVTGVLTGDPRFLYMILVTLIFKALSNLAFHIILRMPRNDWWGAFIIPIYDFLFITFNIHAFFKRTVTWKDDVMHIRRDGVVVKAQL